MRNNTSNNAIHFIGIGAQKAGTSWLYYRLNELPGFSLTPVKELHYFDRSEIYPSPNILSEPYIMKRIKNFTWIKKSGRQFAGQIYKSGFKNIKWLLKWYLSYYNDNWYLSLFDSLKGIKGEITPAYSMLRESDIAKMYRIASGAKLIFLLRNPVERSWSNFRHNIKIKKPGFSIEKTSIEDIKNFINSDAQESRSDYMLTLRRYLKFYPKEQILVGFYDAIKDNPEKLLSEIVEFLGGDVLEISTNCNLTTKNNVSPVIDIPVDVETFLKEKYYSLIKDMSENIGSYCTKWFNDLYAEKNITNDEILSPTLFIK